MCKTNIQENPWSFEEDEIIKRNIPDDYLKMKQKNNSLVINWTEIANEINEKAKDTYIRQPK